MKRGLFAALILVVLQGGCYRLPAAGDLLVPSPSPAVIWPTPLLPSGEGWPSAGDLTPWGTGVLTPSPSPPPVPTEYGIQIDGCGRDPEEALNIVQDMGLTWIKQQVRWSDMESEWGRIDWGPLDRVVEAAHRRGLRVLLSVTTSPMWARPDDQSNRPWSAAFFSDFCYRIIERYRGKIHAIEVFNEPNLMREWGPFMNPSEYAEMLEWTYYTVKQTDPDIMVISAGLAPTQWNAWDVAIPDDVFLIDLLSQGGVKWADCIGAHFNHGTESPLVPGGQFDRLILGYWETVGRQRPICITELGYAVPRGGLPQGFEWASENTPEEQAAWLADVWTWVDRHPGVVRLVIIWNLNYWTEDPQDQNALYALWSPGGLMPAYEAIRRAARGGP